MSNYDVVTTLAAKFSSPQLSRKQQLMVEIMGKLGTAGISLAKPTATEVNAVMATAMKIIQPGVAFPLEQIRAALWWQSAVTLLNSDIYVAGSTPSTIVKATQNLQAFDETRLEALSVYLEGRVLSVFT